MSKISPATLRRVRRRDRIARWVIMLGGLAVIASVIAILALIVGVTLPLFRPAQIREVARRPLPSSLPAAEILSVETRCALDSLGTITGRSMTAAQKCRMTICAS